MVTIIDQFDVEIISYVIIITYVEGFIGSGASIKLLDLI